MKQNFEIPMILSVIIVVLIFAVLLTGCASNILVSNCRAVTVAGEEKPRWLCDKSFGDQWK